MSTSYYQDYDFVIVYAPSPHTFPLVANARKHGYRVVASQELATMGASPKRTACFMLSHLSFNENHEIIEAYVAGLRNTRIALYISYSHPRESYPSDWVFVPQLFHWISTMNIHQSCWPRGVLWDGTAAPYKPFMDSEHLLHPSLLHMNAMRSSNMSPEFTLIREDASVTTRNEMQADMKRIRNKVLATITADLAAHNLSGPGEFEVVRRDIAVFTRASCQKCDCRLEKQLYCSRCRVVAYCGRPCQKSDWPLHRDLCHK